MYEHIYVYLTEIFNYNVSLIDQWWLILNAKKSQADCK